MPSSPFPSVIRRLTAAGFKRAFVRGEVLPDWWDDEIARHPTGLEEGIGILAARLGVVPASLRTGERAEFVPSVGMKFKTRAGLTAADAEPLARVATHALRLACAATPRGEWFASVDPLHLRQRILSTGVPYVSLGSLLDVCWASGVPVLHLSNAQGKDQKGGKTMDGVAARFGDRSGIALCRNHAAPSRQLFILAHEIGHLALGHIPENGFLLDMKAAEDTDDEERQANDFAWALLTGRRDYVFYTSPRWKAAQIAEAARYYGARDGVSPGVLACHHSYSHPQYSGAAFKAVADLEPGADAVGQIRSAAADALDLGQLPDESADYLARLARLPIGERAA